jgi:hypothetical protein
MAQVAAQHHANEMSTEYFAAGVCGILGIFIIAHFTRMLFRSWTRSESCLLRTLASPVVAVTRYDDFGAGIMIMNGLADS